MFLSMCSSEFHLTFNRVIMFIILLSELLCSLLVDLCL